MTGLAKDRDSKDRVRVEGLGNLDADQTIFNTNSTPPVQNIYISFTRDVSSEDVETQKLDVMPGFRFSWWYTGAEVTPDPFVKDKAITKQFLR